MGLKAVDQTQRDLANRRSHQRTRRSSAPFERFTRPRIDEHDQPFADQGLFGPGSMSWRIHAHPMLVVGGFRALMLQTLHPLAMAGIAQHSDYRADPLGRLRRTASYMHTVIFSDAETARAAGARVLAMHQRIRGFDPVSNRDFDASDPEMMLWVHCVQSHSFLASHRAFVEPLTTEEQNAYLHEQVRAAELVGIPRTEVPGSLDAYRGYFAAMLPKLCASRESTETIRFVARPNPMLVPPAEWPFAINLVLAARAAVTLVPRSLRPMMGLPRPGASQYLVSQLTRANGRILNRALELDAVAQTVDEFSQRKLGTTPLPPNARR